MGRGEITSWVFNILLISLFVWFLTFLWAHLQDSEGEARYNCTQKIETDFPESKVSIDRVVELRSGYEVYTTTEMLDGNELIITCWMDKDGSFEYMVTGDDEH